MARLHLRHTGSIKLRFGFNSFWDGWNIYFGRLFLAFRKSKLHPRHPYQFFDLDMGRSMRRRLSDAK